MQTVERQSLESKLENIGNVLRLTAWIGLAAKIGFGAVALLLVIFATTGRSFSQATARLPGAFLLGLSYLILIIWAVALFGSLISGWKYRRSRPQGRSLSAPPAIRQQKASSLLL